MISMAIKETCTRVAWSITVAALVYTLLKDILIAAGVV
jgi:hypothetical protein